jgi:hypothetical protein
MKTLNLQETQQIAGGSFYEEVDKNDDNTITVIKIIDNVRTEQTFKPTDPKYKFYDDRIKARFDAFGGLGDL